MTKRRSNSHSSLQPSSFPERIFLAFLMSPCLLFTSCNSVILIETIYKFFTTQLSQVVPYVVSPGSKHFPYKLLLLLQPAAEHAVVLPPQATVQLSLLTASPLGIWGFSFWSSVSLILSLAVHRKWLIIFKGVNVRLDGKMQLRSRWKSTLSPDLILHLQLYEELRQ